MESKTNTFKITSAYEHINIENRSILSAWVGLDDF